LTRPYLQRLRCTVLAEASTHLRCGLRREATGQLKESTATSGVGAKLLPPPQGFAFIEHDDFDHTVTGVGQRRFERLSRATVALLQVDGWQPENEAIWSAFDDTRAAETERGNR
jgi:hypothetical protein